MAGHGRIVAEFCDVGYSRMLAWARRPQAAALVAALADPDRGWDAIVIGEYERALGLLIASRVVQGIGAALLTPAGLSCWSPAGQRAADRHPAVRLGSGHRHRVREAGRQRTAVPLSGPRRPCSRAVGFALAYLLATRVVPSGPSHPHMPQPHHLFRHHAGRIP